MPDLRDVLLLSSVDANPGKTRNPLSGVTADLGKATIANPTHSCSHPHHHLSFMHFRSWGGLPIPSVQPLQLQPFWSAASQTACWHENLFPAPLLHLHFYLAEAPQEN